MTNQPVIRWGILGPGVIARAFSAALPHVDAARLVAIATRDPAVVREGRDWRMRSRARAS
jgi:predicted dehydrogenase